MINIDDIRQYLCSVADRPATPSPEAVQEALAILKRDAAGRASQVEAKILWCLEQALIAQNLYLRAFLAMKGGHFYEAWCDLENAEISLGFLEPHESKNWVMFRLDFIQAYITKWQTLFPYKIFISPELLELEKVCTICRRPVSIRQPCGHRIGEIYNGEMCGREVTKLEALGFSFVEKPVQKYSVPFISDPVTGKQRDHHNYDVVKYAISALRSPFDGWDVERTKRRQPHSRFRHVGRNEPCPCESGKQYKNCCLQEVGVLRPHFEFHFRVPPPPGVPAKGSLA